LQREDGGGVLRLQRLEGLVRGAPARHISNRPRSF
jgi:hypothetical protein